MRKALVLAGAGAATLATAGWVVARRDRSPGLRRAGDRLESGDATEEELRRTAELFHDLAESVSEVLWVTDPSLRRLLYVSPAWERVWGRPLSWAYEHPDELLDAVHPEDRSLVEKVLRRAPAEPYEVEYRILRPDGASRCLRARGFPVYDDAGRVRRVVGIAEDVTERREREHRNRYLAEASHVLASSLDYEETLREIVRLAVPEVADWCAIHIEDGGELRLVEVAHHDPARIALAREFRDLYPPSPDAPYGAYHVMRTGKAELIREVADEDLRRSALDERHLRMLRELQFRSILSVPMVARGRALGVITLILGESGRLYSPEDVGFAEDLASRAALAVDNARLHLRARRERERSENILESIGDAFFALDRDWRFTYVNRRATAVFESLGVPPEELLGRTLWEAVPDAVGTIFEERYRTAMREQRSIQFEGYFEPSSVWFEVNAYASPEGLSVYFHDVTARKRAEEERERLLRRERFLAEASSVLASSLDYEQTLERVAWLALQDIADYCLVDVLEDRGLVRVAVAHDERQSEQLLRERVFPPREGSGSPALDVLRTGEALLVPRVTKEWLDAVAQSPEHRALLERLSPRSVVIAPLRARDRTFGLIWMARTSREEPYSDADLGLVGEVARRAAVAIDNARLYAASAEARGEAERRAREEAALREAAGAVAASFTVQEVIQQIARSAIMATNADGAFVERIDATGTESRVVAVAGELSPDVWTSVPYEGSLAQLLVERREPVIIARLRDSVPPLPSELGARYADWSAVAVPLLNAGEPIGALMILRAPERLQFRPDEAQRALTFGDLAALAFRKVHLMEESERRREELERVTESRLRLMRGFSHDLKNPLGAADGLLELLQDGVLGEVPPKAADALHRSRRALKSAMQLIDDLLELARAETGQIEIRSRAVDVREAAHDVAEEYRASAEAGGLTLEIELPDTFPVVPTDVARVRQVLGNLLSNAVKYTPSGGRLRVCVQLRDCPWAAPHPCAVVEVSDTGPGIPPEHLAFLFEEFTRLQGTGGKPGAGVGLAISRRVAQALGGDLTVESRVGHGTTFTLWLPFSTPSTATLEGPRSPLGPVG